MRPAALILLAAGGSTRMGRPKQLLPWNGRTLLRHAAETALATPCRPVLVVLGCQSEACQIELHGLDILFVTNPNWIRGLGGSLSLGVTELETRAPEAAGAAVMLVDQPAVTPALIGRLLAAWAAGHPIAAMRYPEGGGVPAVFDRACFPELRALDGDRGARALIAREPARVLLIQPDEPLVDLDTPELYRQHARP